MVPSIIVVDVLFYLSDIQAKTETIATNFCRLLHKLAGEMQYRAGRAGLSFQLRPPGQRALYPDSFSDRIHKICIRGLHGRT